MNKQMTAKERQKVKLDTPTDLGSNATRDISGALNALLADVFALYMKTKNFHWHVSGPHFRSLHLLFDEHGAQLFAMTDNDAEYVDPLDMVAELGQDNQALIASMRQVHDLCDEENDVATASLLENWIDEAEKRVWFLFETSRAGDPGH